MYYPAIATGALFTAIILNDTIQKVDKNIMGQHGFLGIISIILMATLTNNNAEYVAWGILVIPFFILGIVAVTERSKAHVPAPAPVPVPAAVVSGQTIQIPTKSVAAVAGNTCPPPSPVICGTPAAPPAPNPAPVMPGVNVTPPASC